MSWANLDDGFSDHPKVLDLSDAAFRLHVCAMCWCSRRLTDGLVKVRDSRTLGTLLEGCPDVAPLVRELEEAGLWDPCDGGWRLHNWLKWNQPAARVEQRREAARLRMADKRKRGENESETFAGSSRERSQEIPAPLLSSPLPNPIPSEEAKASMLAGGPSPTPPTETQIALLPDVPQLARKTRERKPRAADEDAGKRAAGAAVWGAYAEAFGQRYGCEPQRNARVNGQIAQFLARVPLADAPEIARWYVRHSGAFYAARMHAIGLMLQDAEKLAAEWRRGEQVNAETARRNEQTEANPFAQELLRRQRERAQRGEVIKLVPRNDEDDEDDADEN